MIRLKKIKTITANDVHELALNLSLQEYYNLFQIIFNNIIEFLKSSEELVIKYNQEFKVNNKSKN